MICRTCLRAAGLAAGFALAVGGLSSVALGADNCTFGGTGDVWVLEGDCTTDTTIYIPDGYTLDGRGHAITAVDPPLGHFSGAVISNGGDSAYVTDVVVQAQDLSIFCHTNGDNGPDERLRGILFEGAEGAIWQTTVQGINQGASGCQEGNAIEVRNDGTGSNPVAVEITQNVVEDYQKTGIICSGDVDCSISHNFVGASATQQNLAANSVQISYGANALLELNHIAGNQWLGASDYAATAVLVLGSDDVVVRRNNIGGNSDVGVYFIGDDGLVDNNRIFDGGPDGNQHFYDYGLIVIGTGNEATNNKIRGFDEPTYGVDGGQVIIPGGGPNPVCFGTDCDGAL